MDIRNYELFVDVAETGSFTKSADRLGHTQSNVSHILKAMEEELGFPLFVRNRRGVSLTPEGEKIYPLIRELLSCSTKITETAAEICGLETGTVRIGTFTSIAIHWLPGLIKAFEDAHPSIKIEIKEGGSDEISSWISESAVDVGFLSERHDKKISFIPLFEDPLTAVLPLDYDTSKLNGRFPIKDMDNKQFIMSSLGTEYDIHYAINESGITPITRFQSTDDHAIIAMVAEGLGLSILPDLISKGYSHIIKTMPLDPPFKRTLGIAFKNADELSPSACKFMEFAKEFIKKMHP